MGQIGYLFVVLCSYVNHDVWLTAFGDAIIRYVAAIKPIYETIYRKKAHASMEIVIAYYFRRNHLT